MDATLRGHAIKHVEYLQVGKGRDMGLLSILTFFAKLSAGTAEMTSSRQVREVAGDPWEPPPSEQGSAHT